MAEGYTCFVIGAFFMSAIWNGSAGRWGWVLVFSVVMAVLVLTTTSPATWGL